MTASPKSDEPAVPLVLLVRLAALDCEEHPEAPASTSPAGLPAEPLDRLLGDDRDGFLERHARLLGPRDPDRVSGEP